MAEGSGLELRQCGTLFVTKIRQAWREEHQAACVNGSAHGYRLMASVPRFVDPPRWSPEAFCLDHFSRKPKAWTCKAPRAFLVPRSFLCGSTFAYRFCWVN